MMSTEFWFLIGAALVFWMQAGFAMVESGFTRAKNAGNIIMKNLMDFVDRYGFENICTNPGDFIAAICEYMMKDMEYYRMLAMSNILNNFIWRLVNVYYEKLLDGSVMSIEPKTKITRAEMAQLLYNMLGKAKLI